MIAEIEKELNDIESVPINPDKLATFTSEEDFTGLGVDLLVEAGSYVCVAACILPGDTKRWNRNQAIIGGNIVRLYKLISGLLDQTCQRRRETTFIFARLAFETIVNIKYLIKCASPELFDSYIRYSLRYEKKLRDRIHENIKARGGVELPIERRMLSSIEQSARKSEVSLADVSLGKPKNWGGKNLFERAEGVGLADAYLAVFGGGSHTVHGNWMDLLEYHLEEIDGGFGPQPEWQHPRPQILFVTALLATESVGEYFTYIGDKKIAQLVDSKLVDLVNRIRQTDEVHERFLTSRMGKEPSSDQPSSSG